jgi:hypothetical protein
MIIINYKVLIEIIILLILSQVVVTPRVREEVQRHYNCDQLSGAELEDQGEEGTALTHWEKRLFEVKRCIHSIFTHREKRLFEEKLPI